MSDYQMSSDDERISQAIKFWRFTNDADTMNRAEALDDLKFSGGDQWPVEIQNSRNLESRPCLTINKIDAYCRQVENQQRQQRPRIKVHPMNNEGDFKVAEIIQGIIRHIEINSSADTAYDTAFSSAVRMGWGYWRITTNYVREDSFDQEIFIDPIDSPFTVYFDPNSVLPDGSDAEHCLITTVMEKKIFRDTYPGADDGASFTPRSTGDITAAWVTKEDIRIGEYFYFERKKAKLYLLSNGATMFADGPDFEQRVQMAGLQIVSTRESFKKQLKWIKFTAIEVLEERDLPNRWIPVVPVYGSQIIVDGKRKKYGLVRYAKDPQRMYNFWRTSMTESVALAPKAKWILAEGQDEGHENDWALANVKSMPVLRYKQTDIDGRPAPPPQRLQPEPPPMGIMEAAGAISMDLQTVIGIMDPNQLPSGNISGKALNGQQAQVDMANFHYYDNLCRSMRHTGKIILDLIPHIYDTQRVMRIIGDDGQPDLVTINEQTAIGEVLNDVTVGEYDVTMDAGPGYLSKRQAAVDAMAPIMQGNQELFNLAGDLFFRNMDFPGADVIADRLASINPLAQVDSKSDVPPQAQMQLAQSQQQIQQLQQQLQAAQLEINNRLQVAQVKEEAATRRKLMEVTAKAHNTETMAEVRVHDTNMKSVTAQNRSEIDAITELLLHRMDTARLQQEIARRNAEQAYYGQQSVADISQGANPFLTGGQ